MTIGDKLLVIFIFILSVFTILNINYKGEPMEKYAIVRVDGKEITRVYIEKDTNQNTHSFTFGENIGTLETLNGRIRMLPMDKKICPESICSNTGWIENTFEMIVCLPNKIIVTIEATDSNDLDLISMR